MKTRRTGLVTVLLLASISVAVRADAEPQAKAGRTITNSIGMQLGYVPAGRFVLGSPDSEPGRIPNEIRREVTFEEPYYIGVTEVTQQQWRKVMGSTPSFFKGDDLPVEHITWHEAVDFCDRLSEVEGKRYRLPTEAEWEYACRAGSTTPYNTGVGEAALAEAGWFRKNGGNHTHPVGVKMPNAWGLYDMHGNVSEWCAKRPEGGEAEYATGSAQLEEEEKAGRDHRGGSWGLGAGDCRAASRHRNDGNFRFFDLGVRVLLEVD